MDFSDIGYRSAHINLGFNFVIGNIRTKRTCGKFNWQFTSADFASEENCAKNIDVHRTMCLLLECEEEKNY